jgi:LysR family transcriptional regulator, regulator for metE and metH
VLRDLRSHTDYVTRPLGPQTITKRLYAATREEDATKPFMAHFLRLGRTEPVKLQRR